MPQNKKKHYKPKRQKKEWDINYSNCIPIILATCPINKEHHVQEHLLSCLDDEIEILLNQKMDQFPSFQSFKKQSNNCISGTKRKLDENNNDLPPTKKIKLDNNNNNEKKEMNNNSQNNSKQDKHGIKTRVEEKKTQDNIKKNECEKEKIEDTKIEENIKNELKESKNKHVEWHKCEDGNVLISINNKKINPWIVINSIFKKSEPNFPEISPFIQKIFPVYTCYRSKNDILYLIKQLISVFIKKEEIKDKTFGIVWKKKSGGLKVDRDELIKEIAELVPIKKVDLKNPHYAIIIRMFGFKWCGVNIIPDGLYNKYKNYNKMKFN